LTACQFRCGAVGVAGIGDRSQSWSGAGQPKIMDAGVGLVGGNGRDGRAVAENEDVAEGYGEQQASRAITGQRTQSVSHT